MGGSSQPSTTTQIQKVELPAWVDAASQSNYQLAEQLSNKPYQGYTGDRVADLSEGEKASTGILQQGMDRTNTALNTAQGAATGATGFNPSQVSAPGAVNDVTAQSFLSRNINEYMNPNVQSVIDPTMDSMRRNIALGTQGITDQARGAGAWGGSRHGVAEGVYGAEGVRNMAATEAGLRSSAFTDAAGRIMSDNTSALQAAMANQNKDVTGNAQKLSAEQANQSAGIAGANVRLQGGNLALQTGQTASDTAGRNALLSSQFGAQERAVDQQKLDTDYQTFLEKRDHPTEMLNMRLAALGMSPYGKTTTGTTSTPAPKSDPWMTGIGAAATILPLLFSDRKVKKDVKKIGKVPGTDLNQYEFKYKKAFMGRDTPKQIGLMAQDVEKKVPGAVQPVKVGGKTVKAVDYGMAVAGAKPRDPRDDKLKPRRPYKPRGIGIGGRAMVA